jgi:hypothetical protein
VVFASFFEYISVARITRRNATKTSSTLFNVRSPSGK